MAYTTVDDGSEYFHTQLYTGDGSSSNAITNDANAGNFKPDWLWIKCRSEARDHQITDSTRGGNIGLRPNANIGEFSGASTQFDTDGFTLLDSSNTINGGSGRTYVAWQWKANGGTTSSNSDGDITSTVQANTTAGFSIVTYTGNGNGSDQTVGHGLGAECKVVLQTMRTDSGQNWRFFHESVSQSAGGNLILNGTGALDTSDPARIKSTNTSTFTLLAYTSPYNAVNASGKDYIAYCFAEKQGYSKFGSYTGNGNADGPFVYTGFKPAWLMIKRTSGTENWVLWDNKRDPFNNFYHVLLPNANSAEDTTNTGSGGRYIGDFLSNGFKLRNTHDTSNGSGSTYIYIAFAEHPFVSSKGVPVTAR